MDIKLILENQLVCMRAMLELDIFVDEIVNGLKAQIQKTKERLDRWGSEA